MLPWYGQRNKKNSNKNMVYVLYTFFYFFYIDKFFIVIYFIINNLVFFLEWEIISLNSIRIVISILLDWISLFFIIFVSLISSSVIYYRMRYIRSELNLNRFIYLVLIFVFSIKHG